MLYILYFCYTQLPLISSPRSLHRRKTIIIIRIMVLLLLLLPLLLLVGCCCCCCSALQQTDKVLHGCTHQHVG